MLANMKQTKLTKLHLKIYSKQKVLVFFQKKNPRIFFSFKNKLAHCRFDGIAGALQKTVEETLVSWIKTALKKQNLRMF